MQNIITKQTGNKLTIEIDLSQSGQRSASGKTIVIASTHGNQPVAEFDGKQFILGLNLYTK